MIQIQIHSDVVQIPGDNCFIDLNINYHEMEVL